MQMPAWKMWKDWDRKKHNKVVTINEINSLQYTCIIQGKCIEHNEKAKKILQQFVKENGLFKKQLGIIVRVSTSDF